MDSTDRHALELQKAGQTLFRNKNYKGALEKLQDVRGSPSLRERDVMLTLGA